MKVVVDIPNWLYNAIMECQEPHYSKSLGDAVRDGTQLPKGHGDLIDRNTAIKSFGRNSNPKGFWRKKFFVKGEATMESLAYEINDIKSILNSVSSIIGTDKDGDKE